MSKDKSMDQVTVKFEPELIVVLARFAAEEHRSVSGLIRHYVASAVEARAQQPSAR